MAQQTLFRYLIKQYIYLFIGVLSGLLALTLLIDSVELLRRASNHDIPLKIILFMSVLKLPEIGIRMFPFAILFSAMFLFWKMTRSRELVVVRAFGVSAWQFLAPVVVVAALIGVGQVLFINPAGSLMLSRFDRLDTRYLRGGIGRFDVGRSGIWLSQSDGAGVQAIIRAGGSLSPGVLAPFAVSVISGYSAISLRIEGKMATLEPGQWRIRDAWVYASGKPAVFYETYEFPTELTMERIENGLASPESIGFWELPAFIRSLEMAGLSAVRHRLHYQSLLTQPLVFATMVLFAAAFTMRLTRLGATLPMILLGIVTGFLLFLMRDVVLALGGSQVLPVGIAAWAPAVLGALIGTVAILHLEDG